MFERLAGDVAFQAAHDLSGVQALGLASPDIVASFVIAAHAGQHDPIERRVRLTVTAPVETDPPATASPTNAARWSMRLRDMDDSPV